MSVAVLCFHAGATSYGLAANHVKLVGSPRASVPHFSELLGDARPASGDATRLLQLTADGRDADVLVEGPVDVVEISAADITPCPTLSSPSVIGFARRRGDLLVLLDVVSLVERLGQTEGTA